MLSAVLVASSFSPQLLGLPPVLVISLRANLLFVATSVLLSAILLAGLSRLAGH